MRTTRRIRAREPSKLDPIDAAAARWAERIHAREPSRHDPIDATAARWAERVRVFVEAAGSPPNRRFTIETCASMVSGYPSRRMNPPRRILDASLALLLVTGCLPDPPMYDPCDDRESGYYTVTPRGCDGHAVEILWEKQCTAEPSGASAGLACQGLYGAHLWSHLDRIYWGYDSRLFWLADAGSESHAIDFTPRSPDTRIIGFDADHRRLYLMTIAVSDHSNRMSTEIIGIDVETEEARLLAEIPDLIASTAKVAHGKVVFVAGPTAYLVALDWDSTATISDVRTCPVQPAALGNSVFVETQLYWIDRGSSRISGSDLEYCSALDSRAADLTPDAETLLHAVGTTLYLQQCSWTPPGCRLERLGDGDSSPLVPSVLLAADYQRFSALPLIDGDAVFATTRLSNTPDEPPRLYQWADDPESPRALAAPLGDGVQLAATPRYVYALELGNPAWSSFDGNQAQHTIRLLRVRR